MREFRAFRVCSENNKTIGRVENLNIDDLNQGEVLIKSAYSSVNYKDALAGTGVLKLTNKLPMVIGINVSGNVVSSSDERFKEGDAVLVTGYEFGVGHDGGFSEYCRVPSDWVVPLPNKMSLFDAMAIGTAGFTVALCVQRLEENNQTADLGEFVVTGASGGVGNFAIDIMSSLGYEVVAVTGKADSHESLQTLGAKQILDRNKIQSDGPPLEKGQWGGGIDNVGGDEISNLILKTKNYGQIVTLLQPSSNIDWSLARFKNLKLSFEVMLTPQLYNLKAKQIEQTNILKKCSELFDSGKLKIHVDNILPIENIAQAHEIIEDGHASERYSGPYTVIFIGTDIQFKFHEVFLEPFTTS